jgi:hypothetical protein
MWRRKLKFKAIVYNAVFEIPLSSAQTVDAFNTGFDTVNLHQHHPTLSPEVLT